MSETYCTCPACGKVIRLVVSAVYSFDEMKARMTARGQAATKPEKDQPKKRIRVRVRPSEAVVNGRGRGRPSQIGSATWMQKVTERREAGEAWDSIVAVLAPGKSADAMRGLYSRLLKQKKAKEDKS